MMFKRILTGNVAACIALLAVFAIAGMTPLAAADPAIRVVSNGDVGMGTEAPQSALHIVRTSGATTVAKLENSTDSTVRLDLKSLNADWRFSNQNGPFAIREDGDPVNELTLNKGGDLIITGTLTTGGPSCGGGCDAVFAQNVETIDEHAKKMWQQQHLPGVGPTAPGGPMNVSEKVGGLLNELEKAHIYIDRLNGKLKEKDDQYSQLREEKDRQIAQLSERMERLETLLLDTGVED